MMCALQHTHENELHPGDPSWVYFLIHIFIDEYNMYGRRLDEYVSAGIKQRLTAQLNT